MVPNSRSWIRLAVGGSLLLACNPGERQTPKEPEAIFRASAEREYSTHPRCEGANIDLISSLDYAACRFNALRSREDKLTGALDLVVTPTVVDTNSNTSIELTVSIQNRSPFPVPLLVRLSANAGEDAGEEVFVRAVTDDGEELRVVPIAVPPRRRAGLLPGVSRVVLLAGGVASSKFRLYIEPKHPKLWCRQDTSGWVIGSEGLKPRAYALRVFVGSESMSKVRQTTLTTLLVR